LDFLTFRKKDRLMRCESVKAESAAAPRQCHPNLWMNVDKSGDNPQDHPEKAGKPRPPGTKKGGIETMPPFFRVCSCRRGSHKPQPQSVNKNR
jgi:hypothetical protein